MSVKHMRTVSIVPRSASSRSSPRVSIPLAPARTGRPTTSVMRPPFLRTAARRGRRRLGYDGLELRLGRLDERELLLRRLGDEAVPAVQGEVDEAEEDHSDRGEDRPAGRARVPEGRAHRDRGEEEG